LPVFQPKSLSLFADTDEGKELFNSGIDLVVVAAYAQILPKKILELPRLGCLNVHASLLPKYRGAGVVQAPILNGDSETGVTIIKMDASLDTGPILSQNKIQLTDTETAGQLMEILARKGAALLIDTIKRYVEGEIEPVPQDDSQASYVPVLKKQDGRIDWRWTARRIERQIRAMHPWPGTFTFLEPDTIGQNQAVKIIKAGKDLVAAAGRNPGEIFAHEGRLAIMCADAALTIETIQIPGKKPADTGSFLRGNASIIGKRFISDSKIENRKSKIVN
jgi:methionyl-tRNA formyltransferase